MSCFVMGDSIAVGVAWGMPECRSVTRVGVSSAVFARSLAHPVAADTVVISLGANDGWADTASALRRIRAEVTALRVVWLMPNVAGPARAAIRRVAEEHGDAVLDVAPFSAPLVHPSMQGYRRIGSTVRAGG